MKSDKDEASSSKSELIEIQVPQKLANMESLENMLIQQNKTPLMVGGATAGGANMPTGNAAARLASGKKLKHPYVTVGQQSAESFPATEGHGSNALKPALDGIEEMWLRNSKSRVSHQQTQ